MKTNKVNVLRFHEKNWSNEQSKKFALLISREKLQS